jgi:hypothetical protein
MMAYDSQFVLAIMHNGSPVREISGKVTLPFNSEYKIRLKNKHDYLRAKARVWVDGRKASNLGDFILKPGETLDLERFLDESMTSGRRFKFVPVSDSRVNDPTDEENGIIKVEFYREVDYFNRIVINPNPWPTIPINPKPYRWDDGNSGTPYRHGGGRVTCSNSVQSNFTTSNIAANVNYLSSPAPAQAGATVEGGHSGQQFVEGADFQTEVFPVTLQLRVQGPRKDPVVCPGAKPPKRPVKTRFCPNCGARRMRGAKFCHRCGEKLPILKQRRR